MESLEFAWGTIPEAVFSHAARRPHDEAVRAGFQALTWEQLAQHIEDSTAFLADLGIVEDEPVGLMLSNSIEHIILWLGLMCMGATPMQIPPDAPQATLAPLLREVGVRVMLVEPQVRYSAATVTVPIPPPLAAGLRRFQASPDRSAGG